MTAPADTIPSPPAVDDVVIPSGKAAVAVTGALLDLLTAVRRLEAVCIAVARQLDATAIARPEDKLGRSLHRTTEGGQPT